MFRRSFNDQVVLITGASAGIGEALARELARRGARLVLAARRKERLEALAEELSGAGQPAIAVECDVTREGDVEAAVAAARARFGRLDVVVANAGFGVAGAVESLSVEDFRRQFETNVFGVVRTAKASLDALKDTRGCIAIIGSVNAYLTLPGNSPYGMSKYAVRAFAESLSHELRPHGVGVVLVNPGFVESEIRRVNNRGNLVEAARDPVPGWLQMPAAVAARKIADGIASRRRELNVTGHGKLAIFLARHAPGLLHFALARVPVPTRAKREA